MNTRYRLEDVAADVNRKLHSGNVNQCKDFYGSVDEGRRNMLKKIIPQEMVRTAYLEQAIYDQVDKYAVPNEMKYGDVITIKKLSAYRNVDRYAVPLANVYQREMDQKRRDNIFSVNWSSGLKTMSIRHLYGAHECAHLTLNKADSLSDNGQWNVGGNITGLQVDKLKYITRDGSLRFNINNSGTSGWIENHTMKPVDIQDYLQIGALFTWLDIPYFKTITSVKCTFGSSLTDTYDYTVNAPHDNNEFINAWNLLKFPLDGLNKTGNPNLRAIIYVRFDITTTGEIANACHLDNIVVRKGVVFEMEYNSAYCIIDPETLVWKQKGTELSDLLPFEEDTYQIFMLETAMVVQKEVYALNGGSINDINDIKGDLQVAYFDYARAHKAQYIEPEQHTNLYGRMRYGYYGTNGFSRRGGEDDNHPASPAPF